MAANQPRVGPRDLSSTVGVDPTVVVLRWPEQEAERRRLAALGRPRLLVVEARDAPPVCVDRLEDWVRELVDSEESRARAQVLARRYCPGVHRDDKRRQQI